MNRIGYCCIAIGCNDGKKKKDYITVNRGMVKKTFLAKGLPYASELIVENQEFLYNILNVKTYKVLIIEN